MSVAELSIFLLLGLPAASFVCFIIFLVLFLCTRKERAGKPGGSVNGFLIGTILSAVFFAVCFIGVFLIVALFPQMIRLMG